MIGKRASCLAERCICHPPFTLIHAGGIRPCMAAAASAAATLALAWGWGCFPLTPPCNTRSNKKRAVVRLANVQYS